MKKLLRPKLIIVFVLLVMAFFMLRKQFERHEDVLSAGDQSQKLCPVHNLHLRLDTVIIAVRKEEPDSAYIVFERKNFPMAQDTFYLLQWFQDDEHKELKRAQIWYCPKCREVKRKIESGQSL